MLFYYLLPDTIQDVKYIQSSLTVLLSYQTRWEVVFLDYVRNSFQPSAFSVIFFPDVHPCSN